MKGPELFLLSALALPAVTLAGRTSLLKGARNLQVEKVDDLKSDFYHKSSSSDDGGDGGFPGGFTDNSLGYCKVNKIDEVEELNLLINSPVELVDLFLEEHYYDDDGTVTLVAIKELQDYVKIFRTYAEDDTISDEDALLSVMNRAVPGPERRLTLECIQAIERGFTPTLDLFNRLMGLGKDGFFDPDDIEVAFAAAYAGWNETDHSLLVSNMDSILSGDLGSDPNVGETIIDTKYTYVLDQLEANLPIFEKWRDVALGSFDAFGVTRWFDISWRSRALSGVYSWFEFAISSVPIVGKFGAVYFRKAEQFRVSFVASGVGASLQTTYDGIVATCNAPTDAPSKAPSLSPMAVNDMLMVIAVNDFTSATEETIRASWTAFRTKYPSRPFCLLQPIGSDNEDLKVPRDFSLDGNTIYRKIQIDDGNVAFQSNWFDLCDLYRFEGTQVTVAPVYNGLEPDSKVAASIALFETQLAERGFTTVSVPEIENTVWNWIDPLNVDFVTA